MIINQRLHTFQNAFHTITMNNWQSYISFKSRSDYTRFNRHKNCSIDIARYIELLAQCDYEAFLTLPYIQTSTEDTPRMKSVVADMRQLINHIEYPVIAYNASMSARQYLIDTKIQELTVRSCFDCIYDLILADLINKKEQLNEQFISMDLWMSQYRVDYSLILDELKSKAPDSLVRHECQKEMYRLANEIIPSIPKICHSGIYNPAFDDLLQFALNVPI